MKLEIENIHTPEGRKALIEAYTKSMWTAGVFQKTTWLGVPLLQIPEDMVILAELIWKLRPKLVIECGIYKGGGLLLYASILKLIGAGGKVVGIDIKTSLALDIQRHPLGNDIILLTGDSGDPKILDPIRPELDAKDILVILDSDHSAAHVRNELKVFAPLIQPGGYLVVLDGVMKILHDVPGGGADWEENNPETAIKEFLVDHPEFERDKDCNRLGTTFGPGGYLRRKLPE